MKTETYLQKKTRYDTSNFEVAEVILDDVEGNGGEGSAVVQWARLVLSKSGDKSTAREVPC